MNFLKLDENYNSYLKFKKYCSKIKNYSRFEEYFEDNLNYFAYVKEKLKKDLNKKVYILYLIEKNNNEQIALKIGNEWFPLFYNKNYFEKYIVFERKKKLELINSLKK